MKRLTDSFRISPHFLSWCITFLLTMGAISPGRTFAQDFGFTTNSPLPEYWQNNSTPTKLYCSGSGKNMQIFPDGIISGGDQESKYANFIIRTSSKTPKNIHSVAIQATETKLFLCMNASSIPYSRLVYLAKDCEWTEIFLHNFFNVYQHKHHMWKKDLKKGYPHDVPFILAMSEGGSMLPGDRVTRESDLTHFLRHDKKSSGSEIETTVATPAPKRGRPPKLGCKGIKTTYCRRMRKLFKEGRIIKRAKLRRRCRHKTYRNLSKSANPRDRKRARRLKKRCRRLARKYKARKDTVT